jgi:3-oxoacyl-[acyl-carrier-protein] synthase III
MNGLPPEPVSKSDEFWTFPGLGNLGYGCRGCKRTFQKRGISAMEIDLLIVGTVTGDMIFPSTANIVADKIGAKNAWSFDLSAACSGFLYSFDVGARNTLNPANTKKWLFAVLIK